MPAPRLSAFELRVLVAALQLKAEWVADARGLSHWALQTRYEQPPVQRYRDDGAPIVELAVQTLCGQTFVAEIQAGTRRCSACQARLQGLDQVPPRPSLRWQS